MTHPALQPSPRTRMMGPGMLWFLGATVGAAVMRRSLAHDAAIAVASVYALGTLGMAWITRRATEYPSRSWFATSGLMAVALLVAAGAAPQPSHVDELMAIGWMFPLLFLYLGVTPGTTRGWCAPSAPWSGWLVLGIGLVYTAILFGVTWLG